MFSKFRRLAQYGRIFIENVRAQKKQMRHAESRFLYEANRRILTTDYGAQKILQNDIIVSCTTHRDRIDYIHYMLDSLFFQTIRPQEVRLYLTQGEYQSLPLVFENFGSWLKIIEVEDLGTFKKFIPALQDVSRHQTLISLDDDLIYPPDFIKKLVDLKARHQDSMITYLAWQNSNHGFASVAGCGILWNLDVFNTEANPDFFKKELFIDAVGYRNNDDAWIGIYCQGLGVDIKAVYEDYDEAYLNNFLPLPSERLHAISTAPSELNIASYAYKAEARMLEIVKELMEKKHKIG
ncbi:zn-dependent alcohol dehydrogenase [Helicobacter mustelae]|uniref:hypothetical protein n=1 Tax=Helicobacter mustelae TaxID=217 RepID=UPI000DF8A057|nr:hypothetical protein [Helicobacter mustelae]STP12817.1 zn-dependent alcohol dehydrogenase [Helicobacter mustelae]